VSNPDSDRLLAEGVPLTLRNGGETRYVHVRFPSRAIKLWEDEYGDIFKAFSAMTAPFSKDDPPEGVPKRGQIDTIAWFLHSALLHEPDLTADNIIDWFEYRDAAEILQALGQAFAMAMPHVEDKASDPNGRGPQTTAPSPGNGSIATPPSISAEATTTSGSR